VTRVLITGAAGFLGSNLARRCVQEGFETHILARETSSKWRINDILPHLVEHKADLSEYNHLVRIFQEVKPEIIMHFAAYGAYPTVQKDADKMINTNFIGVVNLARAADTVDYYCFINTGSSSEYGVKSSPMSEADILEPTSLYGVTKAASTLFLQSVAKTTGKPIVTVRPFSAYGYYEEPIRLVPSAIWHCLKGCDMELTSGARAMDFIFVEDIVEAYVRLIDIPGISGQIVNLGTGRLYTVRQVVEKIKDITHSGIDLLWGKLPMRDHIPDVWAADTTKMRELLKWVPDHDVDQGLRKTVDWMEQNIGFYERLKNRD